MRKRSKNKPMNVFERYGRWVARSRIPVGKSTRRLATADPEAYGKHQAWIMLADLVRVLRILQLQRQLDKAHRSPPNGNRRPSARRP